MHFAGLLWFTLAAATPWQDAFALRPDPVPKTADREYFVVHVADPTEMCAAHDWTVEAPFPITDHWLLSHAHGNAKRSVEAFAFGARQVYPSGLSNIQKRAPLPVSREFLEVREEFQIEDPLFGDQWFLFNSREKGRDMNVVPVWRRNITGKGVTVAIVDDGLDARHPDFAESFSLEGSYDYNRHKQQPEPLLSDDTHGTRCAGEIAAGKNTVCGVGIAPDAHVAGIRILSGQITHDDEARSLIHRYDINDIYSCSWGPPDDGKTIDGPPAIVRRAELEGIERGRDGRGSIYVVASGNGDHNGDNCNYDGYTNSIYSITVSAVDRGNAHPYYSESCSANLVATYSSNYFDKISTSDRLDPLYPDTPKCTNQHTGTSAAAPIAAAVFALVLEQRPDLTWRDLQYLVRETAQPFDIQPESPKARPGELEWQTTADGRYYHNSYGYGLLDADKIVERASTWELVKPQTWYFLPAVNPKADIKPNSRSTIEVGSKQWEEANMDHIEHVRVRVSYQHERRGMITFRLISPAGIVSELAAPRPNDVADHAVKDWEFMSVVHWNESGRGVWALEATGPEELIGTLTSWQLKLFGQAKDVSKVRRFSEVWDEYEPPVNPVSADVPEPTQTSPADSEDNQNNQDSQDSQDNQDNQDSQDSQDNQDSQDSQDSQDNPPDSEKPTPSEPSSPETGTSPASPVESETSVPSHESGVTKHALKYYAFLSLLGLVVISCFLGPAIYYFYIKKRLKSIYDPISETDVELNEFADEFEIDDATDMEDELSPELGGDGRGDGQYADHSDDE